MRYHSTEYPISWFRDRQIEGNLKVDHRYQRKLVWKLRQKSHLIESILLGYPIPELFIQQSTTPDGDSVFSVVDGQQRIGAILAFIGLLPREDDNQFELRYVDLDSEVEHLTFAEMSNQQKTAFFGHLIAVRILESPTTEEVRDVFRRFNKYLTKLTDQELRNATYSGPLLQLATAAAEDDYWATRRIVSTEDIRRMRDIEFMSELYIAIIHGPSGGSGTAIDDFYRHYEDADSLPNHVAVRRRFTKTLDVIQEVLPDIGQQGSRWRNKTDFYTLFVAVSHLLTEHVFVETKITAMGKALTVFQRRIDSRLADETVEVPDYVVQYVRAVEKGVSDKARRSARHLAMLEVISRYFKKRRTNRTA